MNMEFRESYQTITCPKCNNCNTRLHYSIKHITHIENEWLQLMCPSCNYAIRMDCKDKETE